MTTPRTPEHQKKLIEQVKFLNHDFSFFVDKQITYLKVSKIEHLLFSSYLATIKENIEGFLLLFYNNHNHCADMINRNILETTMKFISICYKKNDSTSKLLSQAYHEYTKALTRLKDTDVLLDPKQNNETKNNFKELISKEHKFYPQNKIKHTSIKSYFTAASSIPDLKDVILKNEYDNYSHLCNITHANPFETWAHHTHTDSANTIITNRPYSDQELNSTIFQISRMITASAIASAHFTNHEDNLPKIKKKCEDLYKYIYRTWLPDDFSSPLTP